MVHGDVRSDNVCFFDGRAVLVDWSNASRGPAGYDTSLLASALPLEGGPDPFEVMPDGGAYAVHHAGILVWMALHRPDTPPWLARVFRRAAIINLRWAARSLDLPPWTGIDWTEVR